MVLKDRNLINIIKNYNLNTRETLMLFIDENPENLRVEELSRISELVNNKRVDTAAYYTDVETLNLIKENLPEIKKDVIRILEPSVGVGNFLQIIIDKYSYAKKIIIEVNDIDKESIELTKKLNLYRNIPENVSVKYSTGDFLLSDFDEKFDLVIGNPPFLKLNKKKGLLNYSERFNDNITNNLSGFFIQKSLKISDNVVMIMPKYLLSNSDFSLTRNRINNYSINTILDFGEKGFKGVLIETIAMFINTNTSNLNNITRTVSISNKFEKSLLQSKLTSNEFPSWIIYRDDFFESISKCMEFGVFTVFRDRQLTNSVIKDTGDIRVIKSRNINRDGTEIISINQYDSFINIEELQKYAVYKYLENDKVFLSPNMTYYPRVIRKPKGIVVNGSVAILENKYNKSVTDFHLKFLSGSTFERFYRIARNYSTRSLNIDKNSVYFFGLYSEKED